MEGKLAIRIIILLLLINLITAVGFIYEKVRAEECESLYFEVSNN